MGSVSSAYKYEAVAANDDNQSERTPPRTRRACASATPLLLITLIFFIFSQDRMNRIHNFIFHPKTEMVTFPQATKITRYMDNYVQHMEKAVIGRHGPEYGDIVNLEGNYTVNSTEHEIIYEEKVILFEHFYSWGRTTCMNPAHYFIEFYFKMYAYAKFYNDTSGYKILITRLDTRDFNQWCLGIIQASFEGYDIEVLFYNQTEIIVAEKLWWFHFGIDRTYLNWRGGYKLQRYPQYALILDQLRDDVYKYFGIKHGRDWQNYDLNGTLNISIYTRMDTRSRYLPPKPFTKYLNAHILEKMPKTFEEQVRYYSSIDVHIAVSSGSNANVNWMQKDAMYVELEYKYQEDWLLRMGACVHIGYCIGTDYRKTNLIDCENGENERAEIDDVMAKNNQGEGKCFNISDEVARSIAVEIQRRHDPSVFRSAYNYNTGYEKNSVEGPINHPRRLW